MRAWDPAAWSLAEKEIASSPLGQGFLEFFTFWVDAAEKMMSEQDENYPHVVGGMEKYTAHEAIQKAFALSETQFGRQPAELVLQMLAVMVTYWYYRDPLFRDMTEVEKYLVREVLGTKLVQLAEDAQRG